MGNYTLIISKDAQKEISCFYQLGDKAIIKKLEKIGNWNVASAHSQSGYKSR